MGNIRFVLCIGSILLITVTIAAINNAGIIWASVFFDDLMALGWRAQFLTDLMVHLLMIGVWVAWREGFTRRGVMFGVFCCMWGALFSLPYILYLTYRVDGDLKRLLLGVHASQNASG